MWKDLGAPWQAAFEEAWAAFLGGCTPIGAVLCGADGSIIMRGRNRSAEADTLNRRISHAEANILRGLDTDSAGDLGALTLYTTMEPCPMCMGTCVMSGIRRLRYAARDPYCGFAYLADREPYFASKHLDFTHVGGEAEFVQITVQSVYELGYIARGNSDKVLRDFAAMLPEAVETAKLIYQRDMHTDWKKDGTDAAAAFDRILELAAERRGD